MTYSAPVCSQFIVDQYRGKVDPPLRFAHPGDIVSKFDHNVTNIWKAPGYNLDLVKYIMNTYAEPTFQSIKKTVDSLGESKKHRPIIAAWNERLLEPINNTRLY